MRTIYTVIYLYLVQSSKGCVRLRDALKCIGMHPYSHVEVV